MHKYPNINIYNALTVKRDNVVLLVIICLLCRKKILVNEQHFENHPRCTRFGSNEYQYIAHKVASPIVVILGGGETLGVGDTPRKKKKNDQKIRSKME